MGVVLQDSFLFRGTIRDNISAGKTGATFEEVVWAARQAGAEEFIERLPQGYDTPLEEGGVNLSGGQKPAARDRPRPGAAADPSCCSTRRPARSTRRAR